LGARLTEVQRILAIGTAVLTAARSNSQNGNETADGPTRTWQDILGIELISPDQNYLDLGGDSSLVVRVFAQIEKTFKVKLPLATRFFSVDSGCGCALDFDRQGVM
jgi:hypothetical protein